MAEPLGPMKYHFTENGFAQVHFRRSRIDGKPGRRLFCAQDQGGFRSPMSPTRFKFLVTSSDGEPSHEVAVDWLALPELPESADESTDDDFRAFIKYIRESETTNQ